MAEFHGPFPFLS